MTKKSQPEANPHWIGRFTPAKLQPFRFNSLEDPLDAESRVRAGVEEGIREGEKNERRARQSKGGKTQAKRLNSNKAAQYGREDVVNEMKLLGRENPDIRQAEAVRQLKERLNPTCSDKTLQRIFNDWKCGGDNS
jgi:hypothetical protein